MLIQDDVVKMPYQVLIVDDDDGHRQLEREILAGPTYTLSEATNGEQALSMIEGQEFDVVLIDKCMPGMDGDELCRRIRQDLKQTLLPVIIITGNVSSCDLMMSFDAGANDFIGKPYSPIELVARVNAAAENKRRMDRLESAESFLFALARMVEAKDQCTGNHCARLEHTAVVFGLTLGLPAEQLLALRRGGVLHDIGKLGIPDNILYKQGPLSDFEWKIMQQHTLIGARLCSGLKSIKLTVPIVQYHHERWDGSGYPEGLAGEQIPLLARVFQIIDIYDALRHERPYKKALSIPAVMKQMQDEAAKGWRDPYITNIFIKILKERPDDLIVPANKTNDIRHELFDNSYQYAHS